MEHHIITLCLNNLRLQALSLILLYIAQPQALNKKIHCGINGSSDIFYPGQDRKDNYSGYIRRHFINSLYEWHKLNVLNFEMKSSELFTVCATFGLEASYLCIVLAKRINSIYQ